MSDRQALFKAAKAQRGSSSAPVSKNPIPLILPQPALDSSRKFEKIDRIFALVAKHAKLVAADKGANQGLKATESKGSSRGECSCQGGSREGKKA